VLGVARQEWDSALERGGGNPEIVVPDAVAPGATIAGYPCVPPGDPFVDRNHRVRFQTVNKRFKGPFDETFGKLADRDRADRRMFVGIVWRYAVAAPGARRRASRSRSIRTVVSKRIMPLGWGIARGVLRNLQLVELILRRQLGLLPRGVVQR
jgi:hypothetical protein